ncbi:hypothetical protein I302_108493 [Kwoniella bestiolae CBS 10118]|uniref:Zn(2)-C6 fungal-type domain-containing protein n=1 Tax=Kwoniella bestiolae CBS 10118 TaxID=1296100 RepID=A0A1B9FVJ8_9TREE|nr:hypothetical protein I302_07131 [Kwoniella bestiolae CBS 10118]OCF22790.1 hypothetical protein I302_07131 [Kwoniella bestiolae CBS 10118]
MYHYHHHYPHPHQAPPPPYLSNTSVFAISPTPYANSGCASTGGYITTPSEPTSTPGSSSSTGQTHAHPQYHTQRYDDVAMPGTPPTGGTGTIRRGKTGCLTCRIRKKRCDEAKPTCNNCARLELECMGYSVQRPGWLKEKDMEMRLREEIKQKATERRRSKKPVQPKGTKVNLKTKQKQKQKQKSNTNTDKEDANLNDRDQASPSYDTVQSRTEMDDHVEVDLMEVEQDQEHDTSSSSSGPPRFLSLPSQPSRDPPGPSAPLTWLSLPPRDHFATAFPSRNPFYPSQSDHMGVPYPSSQNNHTYTYPPQYPPSDLSNPDSSLEDLWIYLLNSQPDILSNLVSPSPIPHRSLRQSPAPHSAERYFNHYMNVVLPLQFKFVGTSIMDLLASLAMRDGMVMEGLKALGALHLSVYRKKRKKDGKGRSEEDRFIEIETDHGNEEGDDGDVASRSFDRTIQTLRSRTTKPSSDGVQPQPQSLADAEAHFDGLLVSSIAPISYIIFSGGISPQWVESLDIARKYLFRALRDSPELGIFVPSTLPHGQGQSSSPSSSPWKKYKIFLQAMIRTDIAGSITENKPSELLPIYRSLLNRSSIDFVARNPGPGEVDSPGGFALEGIVPTMGAIDNTTLLALAEIVALSQWRTESLKTGTLDIEELVQRGHEIKILLNERSWREKRISISSYNSKEEKDREEIGKLMSDCQYESARLFLAIAVNGPFPKIKGVMEPILRIVDLIGKLKVLENRQTRLPDNGNIGQVGEQGEGKGKKQKQTNEFIRALIFPIAISACHCVPSLQGFFRSLFLNLDSGALMFGNTKYVWMLIEKVWERRNHIHRVVIDGTVTNEGEGEGGTIDWLDVMKRDLGWEKGILLI